MCADAAAPQRRAARVSAAGAHSSRARAAPRPVHPAPRAADGAGGDGDPDPDSEADGLVRSLGCHEESVYSVVWSAADAWLFGSLSFDGRFAINYVPAAEKYRILL